LSEKLTLLLERINRKPESIQPMTEEDMEAQDARVQPLVQRLENRQYREDMLQYVKQAIKEITGELRFTSHAFTCEQCLMELCLDVERYGGNHSGIGWLDLNNELAFDSEEEVLGMYGYFAEADPDDPEDEEFIKVWKEMPLVSGYKIGSYWTGTSEDTVRFVKDRMKWAEKLLQIELRQARRYQRKLKKWNLNGLPPKEFIRKI